MAFLRGKRRFDVRPQAQRINRNAPSFRASSGRGFSVRKSNRLPLPVRLSFWSGCTLVALWSLAIIAGQQPGPGQAVAAEATEYARF